MEKQADAPLQLGRRERGKLDKRRRIREATRETFRRKGYEAATTREIAELADVAIGTLFAYARDKRELLLMVVNDDREALPQFEPRGSRESRAVLPILMRFFEPRYVYWAKEPELSRLAVQQTIDYGMARDPGPELVRFEAGRSVLVKHLAEFFADEQARNSIVRSQSPATIAWLFMSIYQSAVRQWLRTERPIVAEGLNRLRELFRLALSGVAQDPRVAKPTGRRSTAASHKKRCARTLAR
jgi:AcrR family transcriptional regulator